MKKLIFPLLALLLFAGFKAIVNKTITGVVVSADDNKPIRGVIVSAIAGRQKATTDKDGKFSIRIGDQEKKLKFTFIGYIEETVKLGNKTSLKVELKSDSHTVNEVVVTALGVSRKEAAASSYMMNAAKAVQIKRFATPSISYDQQVTDNESYAAIAENGFHKAEKDPLSTFSIDVDAASYSNIRRFINGGALPPKDAVRIEEMINYFDYEYPQPKNNDPVNIVTEIAAAPWNNQHKLVQIGLQAKTMATAALPASNIVFLIDVSGSMNEANKLPLLVSSLKMLTDQLRAKDKVAIVVYAGNSGVVLPSTNGDQKITIKNALEQLSAGGSTAGGLGIKLAYKIAREQFIDGGNNRVILATDGDFNVGASSDKEMEQLIEQERKSGVFLTVLGYGMGNYKDSKMETLADKGNGNYAYIDNISEARKVLVKEFGGTIYTVAKDVKFQVEFNPATVAAYRLIGYENRLLNKEDFNDDRKDAGEIGSGHTVTALYEVIPVGVKSTFLNNVDELKYQPAPSKKTTNSGSNELFTVKLRYKQPDGETSKLMQTSVTDNGLTLSATSNNFRFAAAVAEFGMLLRQSDFKQGSDFKQVIELAENALGKDKEGYRNEFLTLVKSAKLLAVDLLTFKDKKIMDEKN